MSIASAPVPVRVFARQLLLIDVALFILAGGLVFWLYEWTVLPGIVLALAITTLNTSYGYYTIFKYFGAAFNQFMAVVLGGMAKRMIAMLLVVILVLQLEQIDQNSFIIALFVAYICKSVLEMIYINRRSKNPNT